LVRTKFNQFNSIPEFENNIEMKMESST
jgi:hypothetical protein